jgi:SAM-dependent methyltransferase
MRPWQANLRKVARTRFDARLLLRAMVRPDAKDADGFLAPGVRAYRDGPVLVDRRLSPVHLASQFIEDAETYHRRNFERLDFVDLIDRCLALAGVDREAPLAVLDIGSGGGSSVFAAARLLPRAEIFATDISPQLLGMLAGFAESQDSLRGRVRPFCFDLHRTFFRAGTFDVAIGAAILHHLLDPRAALTHVARSMKPGGRMIFVEPLEAGSLLLTTIYARVLAVLDDEGERDGRLSQLMRAFRLDIQCRLGPPAARPRTPLLDDKWVFDEPYLADLARQLGLAKVEIHPAQDDLTHVFEAAFRSMLADSGHAALSVPESAVDAVREFDRSIGADMKRRLCPTGIVVFTK